jgi:hypothetical protein
VLAVIEFADVFTDIGTADTCVALNLLLILNTQAKYVEILSQSKNNRLDLCCQLPSRRENKCLGFPLRGADGLKDGN